MVAKNKIQQLVNYPIQIIVINEILLKCVIIKIFVYYKRQKLISYSVLFVCD